MKNLITYILLLSPLLGMAQTDTVKVSYSEEKVPVFEKTTLIDEYEKAFGGNRIVKSALRLNLDKNLFGNEPEFAPIESTIANHYHQYNMNENRYRQVFNCRYTMG